MAEWGAKLNYSGGEVGMWQNSDKGKVNGIGGSVDMDICYVDYPTVIPAAGKNGYTKPTEDAAQVPDNHVEPPVKDTVKVTIEINGKAYSGVLKAVE